MTLLSKILSIRKNKIPRQGFTWKNIVEEKKMPPKNLKITWCFLTPDSHSGRQREEK